MRKWNRKIGLIVNKRRILYLSGVGVHADIVHSNPALYVAHSARQFFEFSVKEQADTVWLALHPVRRW